MVQSYSWFNKGRFWVFFKKWSWSEEGKSRIVVTEARRYVRKLAYFWPSTLKRLYPITLDNFVLDDVKPSLPINLLHSFLEHTFWLVQCERITPSVLIVPVSVFQHIKGSTCTDNRLLSGNMSGTSKWDEKLRIKSRMPKRLDGYEVENIDRHHEFQSGWRPRNGKVQLRISCVIIGSGAVSWFLKRQPTVCLTINMGSPSMEVRTRPEMGS